MKMNFAVSSGIVNPKLENSLTQRSELPDASWPIIEAAKFHASLGWPVFPVGVDKKPLIPVWQATATTDPRQVAAWWERYPTAGIGMLCGPKSGVAVIDADAKADAEGTNGLDYLDKLEREYGELGPLPTVYTPGGGIHLYVSAASLPFAKRVGQIGPKIDLQSARPDGSGSSYVVVPRASTQMGADTSGTKQLCRSFGGLATRLIGWPFGPASRPRKFGWLNAIQR